LNSSEFIRTARVPASVWAAGRALSGTGARLGVSLGHRESEVNAMTLALTLLFAVNLYARTARAE
jgi:hypothetical protein